MCGIHISLKPNPEALKHRGIETQTIYDHGYFITHHRLPIQTLPGDAYTQPVRLSEGEYLLFNGEIFNIPDGYDSDTEYLTTLFLNEDLNSILRRSNAWDGFWAIVYITRTGTIHCFTDPLGKKQLYYNELGEIASEIRPLVHTEVFDKLFHSSVYKWGYNHDNRTPWAGVKRMIPNRVYTFQSGKLINVSVSDYYIWNKLPKKSSLHDLLMESVRRRLVSKSYPIGVLLSGGLDSSIIAWCLQSLGAKVNYYSIDNGEDSYVNILCESLGITCRRIKYPAYEGILPEIFKWNETPIDLGSVVPQHLLFSVIPERIVMSGDGADELFGGYQRINTYDSQQSDVFEELVYYHLPRLDRASMRFTIELRTPFLGHDVIKYALGLPYSERVNKNCLKSAFNGLPIEILTREKKPLKAPILVEDPGKYKNKIFNLFYNEIFKTETR